MHIVIAHNAVAADAPPDERDVLVQAGAVSAALRRIGHDVDSLPVTLDLQQLHQRLAERPAVVFNLIESLGGSDRLMHLAPALFDAFGVRYTGSPAEAIALTNNKPRAKRELTLAGLPTPEWRGQGSVAGGQGLGEHGARFLVKTAFEHASFGIDESSIVQPRNEAELQAMLRERAGRLGRVCFAERFIDGREFNLSLLAGPDGPDVLPPAEIDFSTFPAEKPRIVGYDAKWAEDSLEYAATPRRFDFAATDQRLLEQLRKLARACWDVFGLRGYARVDFRVDQAGRPWILEVNCNPCLSPDAGFAAAVERAALSFDDAIGRIVADA